MCRTWPRSLKRCPRKKNQKVEISIGKLRESRDFKKKVRESRGFNRKVKRK